VESYPPSDGADRPAHAAQNLAVGFLATLLAHLHVRNLAQKNRNAANDNIFSMAVPDRLSCSRGEGLHHASPLTTTHQNT
jgi:hypothetical protein